MYIVAAMQRSIPGLKAQSGSDAVVDHFDASTVNPEHNPGLQRNADRQRLEPTQPTKTIAACWTPFPTSRPRGRLLHHRRGIRPALPFAWLLETRSALPCGTSRTAAIRYLRSGNGFATIFA